MSNLYQTKKVFDDALKALYGDSAVNNPAYNGTNTVIDGIQIWTTFDNIDDSNFEDSKHISVSMPYKIEFIRGNRDATKEEERKEQASIDFEDIIKKIFETMLSENIRNVSYNTGTIEFIVQNDFQSYGNVVFNINHQIRVM